MIPGLYSIPSLGRAEDMIKLLALSFSGQDKQDLQDAAEMIREIIRLPAGEVTINTTIGD